MEEVELSDYITRHELEGFQSIETKSGDTNQSGRRLLRMGVLTLGLLCILQATLNVSLHLAFNTKEETDQFPCNSSLKEELDQIDQTLVSSAQVLACCNKQLRILQKKYDDMEADRDRLQAMVSRLSMDLGQLQRQNNLPEDQSGSWEGSSIPE